MKPYPDWYYDEEAQKGVDYRKIEAVQAYDLKMQQLRNLEQEVEEVKEATRLGREEVLLDMGTGTGEFAVGISPHCRLIYAVDPSPAMLEAARVKALSRGRENIAFQRGGLLTYLHRGEPVDVAVSQLALHHLPDFWKFVALQRIYRLLKPGGRLYLRDVVFPVREDYRPYFEEIIAETGRQAGEKAAGDMKIHIKEEYSTFDWVMEGLLQKAGFALEKADYSHGFLAAYLCTKK